jgi:phosphoenolpyruvate synthase/pyruvate phosphate dikinase
MHERQIAFGTERMNMVPIEAAIDEDCFGRKAARLAAAAQAGLPVPPTFALSTSLAAAVARREDEALLWLRRAFSALEAPVAVRPSIVERAEAPPAVLNVRAALGAVMAIEQIVVASSAYGGTAAILLQRCVASEVSGRLTTRDDERTVEAWWGLSRPQGAMTVDRFRLQRDGSIVDHRRGEKAVAVRALPAGGTIEVEVSPMSASLLCLDDGPIERIGRLADRCDRAFGVPQDFIWAFDGEGFYLLDRRTSV